MRKDIEVSIDTYDISIVDKNDIDCPVATIADRDLSMLMRYEYLDVSVQDANEWDVRNNGFYFSIPYTPIYKEFMIRIRLPNTEYILNESNATKWHVVKCMNKAGEYENAFLSKLIELSEHYYYCRIDNGSAYIYGGEAFDFNIVDANRQNSNFLLSCHKGNNYRYPLTGVGLDDWVNSNSVQSSVLAKKIYDEFRDDDVFVTNATYNYSTQSMELEINVANSN